MKDIWKPKHPVWFKKNDDEELGNESVLTTAKESRVREDMERDAIRNFPERESTFKVTRFSVKPTENGIKTHVIETYREKGGRRL